MEKSFAEHQKKSNKKQLFDVKTLVILAMITAVAFLLAAFVRFPVLPGPVPLRFDPKDVVIVIGGYLFGPLAAFIVTVVVSLLQFFTVSTTGWIGLLMNIISGTAFAVTAAFVYSKKRTLGGAVIGLIAGTILMTTVMLLWNYIVTPMWTGMPREVIATFLVPFFMPFNIFSGVVNSTLIMLLYKPLVGALKASNLMPSPEANKKVKPTGVVVILSSFALISAGLWTMSMQEIGPFAPSPLVVQGEGTSGNHRSFPTHVTLNPVLDGLGLARPGTDPETGMRTITGFIGPVAFRFGSNRAYLDGEPFVLSHPVMRVDGTSYVPIEFFTTLLGVDNAYYEDGQVVIYND